MVAGATAPRRENVPRHILFYVTERDKAIRYQLVKHLSEAASLIRMEFSKRAWYTQLNKIRGSIRMKRKQVTAACLMAAAMLLSGCTQNISEYAARAAKVAEGSEE